MRSIIQAMFNILICLSISFPGEVKAQTAGSQLKTVVIDAGHGGNDPGAIAGGVREKDLVLSVALRLGNKIKYNYPDVKVIYTRSKDVFIPLYERAAIAIRNKADLFISIHANAVSEAVVRGTETFTLGLHRSQENLDVAKKENSVILLEEDYSARYQGFNPKETESYIMFENMQSEYQSQSIDFAARIQDEFTRNLRLNNRGVKQAGFLVLRETSMPSVLVEIGFISNPAERKFLVSDEGKENVAESVFRAFAEYKKLIDLKSRFEMASSGDTAAGSVISGDKNQTNTKSGTRIVQPESTSEKTSSKSSGDTTATKIPAKTTGQLKTTSPAGDKDKTTSAVADNRKTEPEKPESRNQNWFSVQVGAIAREIEPSSGNFKGETGIYMVKVAQWYKYYSGRFGSYEEAVVEKTRLTGKFPGTFVVIFENGVPRAYVKK